MLILLDNLKISVFGNSQYLYCFILKNQQSIEIDLIISKKIRKIFFCFFSREKLVKEFLHRHVTSTIDLTQNEQMLIDKYNLPLYLILSTKAQRAEYDKQWMNAVRLWIDAKQWRRAHDTYCNYVFHDTLLKGFYYH